MPLDNPSTQISTAVRVSPPATLGDVIASLEKRPALSATRRRDLTSAVRRVAELVGKPAAQLPAAPVALNPLIGSIAPAAHGISPKTWSNLRSNLAAAVEAAGVRRGLPAPEPLTPEWATLFGPVRDKRVRCALSRLIHWCSARGVGPAAVDDTAFGAFSADTDNSLIRKPKVLRRRAARVWNEASDVIPGWPATKLIVPSFRKSRVRLTMDELPASFGEELTRYLASRAIVDPFRRLSRQRTLKPSTIGLHRNHVLTAASALAGSGVSASEIAGLGTLVEPPAFEQLLRFRWEKAGNEWTAYDRNLATTLLSIAEHWVGVEPMSLDELKRLRADLGWQPTELTVKNRIFLRQFDDPANIDKLLRLPCMLAAEARRNNLPPDRRALLLQIAVAIEIELNAPLRLANLAGLDLGVQIRQVRRGLPWIISLTAGETKNAREADHVLADAASKLIDTYVHDVRPQLVGEGTAARFFITIAGGDKSAATLSQQIVETVHDRTGLTMTVHQFRHFAAALLLDANPGALHVVQKLLGHKNLKTTLGFYAELPTRKANAALGKLLATYRRRGRR